MESFAEIDVQIIEEIIYFVTVFLCDYIYDLAET